jgi:large subunit ribosomal protein L6
MSRIGNKPIKIPEGVTIEINADQCRVKGPKGEVEQVLPRRIEVKQEAGMIKVSRKGDEPKTRALHGLARALIANCFEGVTRGFEKKLEIKGVGYRAQLQGKDLVLTLGFSHPVEFKNPGGVEFKVEKNLITISGIDKGLVGQVSAELRALKPPEPYKGKGIIYVGEHIRRKVGKAVGAEEGAAGAVTGAPGAAK